MDRIITVSKEAMKEVLELLGYDTTKINVDEIAGITQEGLIKKDLISIIELSDKIGD